MSQRLAVRSMAIVGVLLMCGACVHTQPTAPPSNRPPVITSVSLSRAMLALHDSVTVTCNATDPDGDSLVFDWITGLPLQIANAYEHENVFSAKPTQIFYYSERESLAGKLETLRKVEVFARDPHGNEAGVAFYIQLQN